jgi:hypothetical protein
MFFVYVYVFNEEFFSTYTTRAARAEKSREKRKFYSLSIFSTDRMNEYDTHKRRRRRRRRRRE